MNKIPSNISDSLIFNPDHFYQVASDVSEEVFVSFIEYLREGTQPDIRSENIVEYILMSNEFNLLLATITEKRKEFDECLINLAFLRTVRNDTQKLRIYEEDISQNLDSYIEKHVDELINSPIQSLYNIFSSSSRKLTKYNEAYELIKSNKSKHGKQNHKTNSK